MLRCLFQECHLFLIEEDARVLCRYLIRLDQPRTSLCYQFYVGKFQLNNKKHKTDWMYFREHYEFYYSSRFLFARFKCERIINIRLIICRKNVQKIVLIISKANARCLFMWSEENCNSNAYSNTSPRSNQTVSQNLMFFDRQFNCNFISETTS